MLKSELLQLIENSIESKVKKSLKPYQDALFEKINEPLPNKMKGIWSGEDTIAKPKFKMHNFDTYEQSKTRGFDTFQDYLKAVRENNYNALSDCRVEQKDVQIGVSPGSFLIPEKFQISILKGMAEKEIIRPLCQSFVLPKGAGETLKIPVVQSEDFSSDETAGVKVETVAEGGTYGESTPEVHQVEMKLNKIGRVVDFTEEVIFGSPVDMGDFISGIFSDALSYKINKLLLKGTGAGECQGAQNSGDLLTISAEVGQDPDTLVAENIFSFMKKLRPGSWGSATWLSSIQNIGEMLKFHVKLGTGAAKIDVFNQADGKFRIMGRPCLLSQHMGALGEAHSIMLCDWRNYIVLTRDGMLLRNDQGLTQFTKDIVKYKITFYIDAQPLYPNYVTLADSETVASFVDIPTI